MVRSLATITFGLRSLNMGAACDTGDAKSIASDGSTDSTLPSFPDGAEVVDLHVLKLARVGEVELADGVAAGFGEHPNARALNDLALPAVLVAIGRLELFELEVFGGLLVLCLVFAGKTRRKGSKGRQGKNRCKSRFGCSV